MPPTRSYVLGIKLSTGNVDGRRFHVRNITTGEVFLDSRVVMNGQGEAVIDLANSVSGYSNGDIIEISVSGTHYSYATHTIVASGGGASVALTGTAVTTTTHPGVAL